MAALAEVAGLEHLSLAGLPLPATILLSEPMSDDELIAFSRRNRPYRIERNAKGELEIMSPVGIQSGEWEYFVGGELYIWAKMHGGRTVSADTGFTLPDTSVRSPDAAWVSDRLWNSLTSDQRRGFGAICPEFLVELLSESDSLPKVKAKMEMWIANGAQLAWMIDPYGAMLSIYRQGKPVEVLDRPDSVEAEGVVPGFRLSLSQMWQK